MAGRVAGRWEGLPAAWRVGVATAVALRLVVGLVAVVGGGLLADLDPVSVAPAAGFAGWTAVPSDQLGWRLAWEGLVRQDALWYLAIAVDGYPTTAEVPQAAAFFPGWPLLVGMVGRFLGGAWLLAANVLALGATAAGIAGVHRLAELAGGQELAGRVAAVLAVFPTAFFLVAPYTEALFLALASWGLVAVQERRWGHVAPLVLGAATVRNVGVLLAIPVAWEVLHQWRQRDGAPALASTEVRAAGRPGPAALGATVAAPVGTALVLALGWHQWGTWLAPLDVQGGWSRTLQSPVTTLLDALRIGFSSPGAFATGYQAIDVVVFLPVLLASVWLLRRGHVGWGLFAAANLLVWLSYPFPDRPLLSTSRFALAVPPIFVAIAHVLTTPARRSAWLATSGALAGIHLLLFVNGYYIL